MTVGADTTEEQIDTAVRLDLSLIACALSNEVLCVTVEDVNVFLLYVNVAEEIVSHE